MVSNTLKTLGRNITFPIYNADGTSFHGLEMKKSTVESVVMSLGDKITGDVYYKDNTLAVTMSEYIEYKANPDDENEEPIHYILVNPPTIVREGMVSDNSELKGMTKYSFEFYHPMYQLGNFPFTDVATTSDEEKYLSENKSFSWIGKPQDFIDKLNKNLQGTVWYVRKSNRFPVEKDDELSEIQQFDKISVAEAIKKGYEIWEIPYIVSQLPSNDPLYAQGKRFVVEYGLPSNEIYENESARQLDTPFVFHMGQGVGLKNNSRTPRNNKIVTRIAGFGSEDNIPYGYPQIIWTGNQDWKYTINNDANNPLSYPIYSGIVGGRYVKLIKHPFTRSHLMPSIFSETVNKKVNPNAEGYNPNIEIKDYYDAVATQEYPYTNEINLQAPSYENHEFEDIKPELDSERNTGIISATPLNNDLTPADHWDDEIDDNGSYIQSYFKIKLPQLSFDLYACAAITQEMKVNMRSGSCIGCTFTVSVDWDDYKKNFYDADGNFAPDGSQRKLDKYPKSNLGEIEIILQKDNNTFGKIMPNVYQQPNSGDLFVFIGISLPTSYIKEAEERLDDAMKSYMLENNVYYFDYPLKFDEYFLATHKYILGQIHPNSIIHFDYGGEELQLFVKQLTVKYGNNPLPQYEITLTDNIEITLNQIGQVANDVEKLSSLISILRQTYSRNVWMELSKKLSKVQDDTAQGFIRFVKGLQVGNLFTSGILGEGGVFRKDADGKTYIEADKMYVRMKAYFDSVEIREYQHTSGNRIASQAKGFTASRVEWLDASGNVTDNINNVVKFRCYWRAKDDEHETQNQFVVGDQAFMEYSDIVDGNLVQKRFWRVVVGRNVSLTEDGEAWIDLSNKANDTITYIDHQGTSRTKSVTGFEPNSSIPQPEDDICQLGNVWDTERQGAIIEYVSGGDAPSYQIFQGIDSFSLNGKNMVGLGYSSLTGKAYMNVYGDAYIGDPQGSTYVKYEQRNSATHAPKLTIKADVDIQSTFGGQTLEERVVEYAPPFDDSEIWAEMANLQDQIDGAIETYYMTGEPSLSLPPVISTQAHPYSNPWLDGTETPAERTKILNNHVGDLYYDKATGRGYRFMYDDENQVFLWTELTDADVAEALRVANDAKDTADGKRTVYSTWGAWIKSGVNTLEVGDLFIPASDTTQGSVTYKAKKVYKCTTDGTNAFEEINYTDDSALNAFKLDQYVQQLINGTISSDITTAQNTASGAATAAATAQGTADSAAAAAAALGYLSQALGQDTAISGGLVLSTLIGLRDANNQIWSGINGAYQAAETGTGYKGHGIAAWYGGAMVDKEVSTTATDFAKSLFRFDGSGYLASGNITWDKNGIVTIANVYSDINGNRVPWSGATLQYITNLSTLLPITIQSGVTYLDPQVGFKQLSILGKAVATQEWVGQNYLSIAFFNRLFQTYNGTTRVNANDTTSTIDNIKAMFGFWTEQYISALGKNTSGGGGSDIDMTTVWSAMANNTNEQINLSHLTTALSGYATQSWVYQQLTGGTVTAVKVGTTIYSPTDGVVSLPAYPTSVTSANIALNLYKGRNDTISTPSIYMGYGIGLMSECGYIGSDWGLRVVSIPWVDSTGGFPTSFFIAKGRIKVNQASSADTWGSWNTVAYTTDNVASATKLETARTLWGQGFDGTDNVSGAMSGVTNINSLLYLSTNVGIGTSNPTEKLDVVGNINTLGTVHATVGIYTEGYVSALGQNTSSDIRLKDVQGDVDLPIDMLANAPSKAFVWKGNKALGEQVGTIAQYWQKHLPQVVHDNNGYLAMQYDVAALLGVISVAKKVKSHEERIAELERENKELKQELKELKYERN